MQEQGNILLGKVLAYMALVQSGRITSATQEHVQKIVQSLVQVCQKRSFLKQISTYAISLIVSQVFRWTFCLHFVLNIIKQGKKIMYLFISMHMMIFQVLKLLRKFCKCLNLWCMDNSSLILLQFFLCECYIYRDKSFLGKYRNLQSSSMVGDRGWADPGVDRLLSWYPHVTTGLSEVPPGNVSILFNICLSKCSCFGGRRIKKTVKQQPNFYYTCIWCIQYR